MVDLPARDLDRLLDTMVAGFSDDPLYRWLYPNPIDRADRLRPTFELMLRCGFERGHVVWSPDQDAVAIWTAPGQSLLDDDAMDRWLQLLHDDAPTRVEAAIDGMTACARHAPAAPHWTLHSVVVAADRQRRGTGTALLRRTLSDVDRTGDPAYLESSNIENVSAYQRLGFRVLGEVQVPGGPIMRPMARPSDARSQTDGQR